MLEISKTNDLISGNLAISDDNCLMPCSTMSCQSKSLRNLTHNVLLYAAPQSKNTACALQINCKLLPFPLEKSCRNEQMINSRISQYFAHQRLARRGHIFYGECIKFQGHLSVLGKAIGLCKKTSAIIMEYLEQEWA